MTALLTYFGLLQVVANCEALMFQTAVNGRSAAVCVDARWRRNPCISGAKHGICVRCFPRLTEQGLTHARP